MFTSKLKLNLDKSEFMLIGWKIIENSSYHTFYFSQAKKVKNLGVVFYFNLFLSDYMSNCKVH